MLLNRRVARDETADPETLIRGDLRALTDAPTPYRAPSRLLARIAHQRDRRDEALNHMRRSAAEHAEIGAADDAARERFALGTMLGGAEGQQLTAAALLSLKDMGVHDPIADLRAYWPELLRGLARR